MTGARHETVHRQKISLLLLPCFSHPCFWLWPQAIANTSIYLKEQPIRSPYQHFRIVQICLDTPPLYPESLFRTAANTIADRIDSSITVNYGGMGVYVTLITHDSYQDDVLQFTIPSFPADPPKPQLVRDITTYLQIAERGRSW